MPKANKKFAIEKLERAIHQIDQIKISGRKAPKFDKWKRDTEIAILYVFGDQSRHIQDFRKVKYNPSSTRSPKSVWDREFLRGLERASAILHSMVQEVEEYWDDNNEEIDSEDKKAKPSKAMGKEIFLVHGHDEGLKETVARFLSKLDLNPIILHEKPNQGRTIIEKFEEYSSVSYAIALITPDDFGGSNKSPEEIEKRARQNVIFEFGFFIGKLGRKNVIALYEEGVVLPSDYLGVVYILLDSKGH